jgi:hypothetical protein
VCIVKWLVNWGRENVEGSKHELVLRTDPFISWSHRESIKVCPNSRCSDLDSKRAPLKLKTNIITWANLFTYNFLYVAKVGVSGWHKGRIIKQKVTITNEGVMD